MAAVKLTVGIFVASAFGLRVLVNIFPRLVTTVIRGPNLALTGTLGKVVACSCREACCLQLRVGPLCAHFIESVASESPIGSRLVGLACPKSRWLPEQILTHT